MLHLNRYFRRIYRRCPKSNWRFHRIVFVRRFVNRWAMSSRTSSTWRWHFWPCTPYAIRSNTVSYSFPCIGTYKVLCTPHSSYLDTTADTEASASIPYWTTSSVSRVTKAYRQHECFYSGTITHTWILAPYYPWKVRYLHWSRCSSLAVLQISHNHHHKNTGNIDKEEVFYPKRGESYEPSILNEILRWLPGTSWFYYLMRGYAPRPVNHFNPVGRQRLEGCDRLSLHFSSNRCSMDVICSVFVSHSSATRSW